MLNLVATIEASVDFSDDVGDINEEEMKRNVVQLVNRIELHLNDANAGERLRNGVQICIIGKPNVGKSSLFNALSQRPAAIVSPIAGTTRDAIEQHLDVGGFPIKLLDTAGLRDSAHADTIELEGMKRAADIAKSSDLAICILDASEIPKGTRLVEWCDEMLLKLGLENKNLSLKMIVLNKCDLLNDSSHLLKSMNTAENACLVSCKTKEGLDTFTQKLKQAVEKICTRDQGKAR